MSELTQEQRELAMVLVADAMRALLALNDFEARDRIVKALTVIETECVRLVSNGPRKIQVIRAIRETLSLDLRTAKAIAERAPCDIPCGNPDGLRAALIDAGAKVE